MRYFYHYENLFYEPTNGKQFNSRNYGNLNNKLDSLNWEYRHDEEHIENDYVGEPDQYLTYSDFTETKKWYKKTMKKAHRTTVLSDGREYYSFQKGGLWLGGRN